MGSSSPLSAQQAESILAPWAMFLSGLAVHAWDDRVSVPCGRQHWALMFWTDSHCAPIGFWDHPVRVDEATLDEERFSREILRDIPTSRTWCCGKFASHISDRPVSGARDT